MKKELSSVDVRVLVSELKSILGDYSVDKAYQVGGREFVFKLYGGGTAELVVAPNFMCVTKYKRHAPKSPSSFSMQLRKHLRGKRIMDIRQHGFDRIVELIFENCTLVIELFSKGNIILCEPGGKILGLLDWQKWKDRTLGVGKTYEYPPTAEDPYSVDFEMFKSLVLGSERGCAAALATKLSLGGYYAEKICEDASINPKKEVDDEDVVILWTAFENFRKRVDGKADASASEDNVVPFGGDWEKYSSFNEAVDEYFSTRQIATDEETVKSGVDSKRQKFEQILEKQKAAFEEAKIIVDVEKAAGDSIYQSMHQIEEVVSYIRAERKKNVGDSQILEGLRSRGIVKGLKGYDLVFEL